MDSNLSPLSNSPADGKRAGGHWSLAAVDIALKKTQEDLSTHILCSTNFIFVIGQAIGHDRDSCQMFYQLAHTAHAPRAAVLQALPLLLTEHLHARGGCSPLACAPSRGVGHARAARLASYDQTLWINVRDMRDQAQHDDDADDLAMIQTAIDTCRSGQRVLYFPPGLYRIKRALNWSKWIGLDVRGGDTRGTPAVEIRAGSAISAATAVHRFDGSDGSVTGINFTRVANSYDKGPPAPLLSPGPANNAVKFSECAFDERPAAAAPPTQPPPVQFRDTWIDCLRAWHEHRLTPPDCLDVLFARTCRRRTNPREFMLPDVALEPPADVPTRPAPDKQTPTGGPKATALAYVVPTELNNSYDNGTPAPTGGIDVFLPDTGGHYRVVTWNHAAHATFATHVSVRAKTDAHEPTYVTVQLPAAAGEMRLTVRLLPTAQAISTVVAATAAAVAAVKMPATAAVESWAARYAEVAAEQQEIIRVALHKPALTGGTAAAALVDIRCAIPAATDGAHSRLHNPTVCSDARHLILELHDHLWAVDLHHAAAERRLSADDWRAAEFTHDLGQTAGTRYQGQEFTVAADIVPGLDDPLVAVTLSSGGLLRANKHLHGAAAGTAEYYVTHKDPLTTDSWSTQGLGRSAKMRAGRVHRARDGDGADGTHPASYVVVLPRMRQYRDASPTLALYHLNHATAKGAQFDPHLRAVQPVYTGTEVFDAAFAPCGTVLAVSHTDGVRVYKLAQTEIGTHVTLLQHLHPFDCNAAEPQRLAEMAVLNQTVFSAGQEMTRSQRHGADGSPPTESTKLDQETDYVSKQRDAAYHRGYRDATGGDPHFTASHQQTVVDPYYSFNSHPAGSTRQSAANVNKTLRLLDAGAKEVSREQEKLQLMQAAVHQLKERQRALINADRRGNPATIVYGNDGTLWARAPTQQPYRARDSDPPTNYRPPEQCARQFKPVNNV
jgi:hypothetical protein